MDSKAHLNNTQLNDRVLWFDGDSSYHPSMIQPRIASGVSPIGIFVSELTDDIAQYNKFVSVNEKINVKTQCNPLSFQWNVSDEAMSIDVEEYIKDKLEKHCDELGLFDDDDSQQLIKRTRRVAQELKLYYKYNAIDILKVLIHIINILSESRVVWGVGRGSSVSSYVLFLIGVHDVDSVYYHLDVEDFLHD